MDRSQRFAALLFAITFPLAIVLMMVAFTRFLAPILVWNQDAETARNLIAHAHTYRIFIVASCLNGLAGVVLLTALYVTSDPSIGAWHCSRRSPDWFTWRCGSSRCSAHSALCA